MSKTAPTELLAQFLSTIMSKDYRNAATFCKLGKLKPILSQIRLRHSFTLLSVQQFEPTNEIAKAFYPKLLEKIEININESEAEDEEDEEVVKEELDNGEENQESEENSSTTSEEEVES